MGKVEEIINGSDTSPYAIFVSGDSQYDSTIFILFYLKGTTALIKRL